MAKEFNESIRCFGGMSLEYSAVTEVDFTAPAGAAYTPPEAGNFRRNNVPRCIQLLSDATGVVETFQTSAAELRLPANTIFDETNDAGNGRLFFLKNSGTGNLVIKDYLGNTLWVARQGAIIIIIGNDNNNWDFYFSAKNIDFNNSSNGYLATDVQAAIEESRSKAGVVTAGSFVGSPRKVSIVFNPPFPAGTTYAITISAEDKRFWSYESPTESGFILNSNASQPLSSNVSWMATAQWG